MTFKYIEQSHRNLTYFISNNFIRLLQICLQNENWINVQKLKYNETYGGKKNNNIKIEKCLLFLE